MNIFVNPNKLYRIDPMAGPTQTPKPRAHSKYPIYFIFCCLCKIAIMLKLGTCMKTLEMPCQDLKNIASMTIIQLFLIYVIKPIQLIHMLIHIIPNIKVLCLFINVL